MSRILHYIKTLAQDYNGASRLAADPVSWMRLMGDFTLYRMMRRGWRTASYNRERVIRFRGGTKIFYRLNLGDIWVIHEVWIAEIYRYPIPKEVKTLVDLGANIGMASLWMAKEYGYSHIIAVEPSEENAALLRKNLLENGLNAEIVCAAAGSKDGFTLFAVSISSTNGRVSAGVSPTEITAKDDENIAVPVVSMSTLFQHLPQGVEIDTLKVDIEGGEEDLLTGDLSWLSRVKTIIAEFHPKLVDYPALAQTLQCAGFKGNFPDLEGGNDVIDFLHRN